MIVSVPHCSVQWGLINSSTAPIDVMLPISVSTIYAVAGNDYNNDQNPLIMTYYNFATNRFTAYGIRKTTSTGEAFGRYLAICR